MSSAPDLKEKIDRIQLLVLDVDGVLTDGKVILGNEEELKQYDVKDGAGIKYLMRSGIRVAILTGRQSRTVERRSRELGVTECLQGRRKKLPAYLELIDRLDLNEEAVACMGDDLPDLPLFNHCGLSLAPADATPEVRERADFVSSAPGGHGAVREAVEVILKTQGKWTDLLESYLVQ